MNIKIEQESRGQVEEVMGRFRGELSGKQILIGTAQAINHVLTRTVSRLNKSIKQEYNVKPKQLSRTVQVSPRAHSSTLWGGISIRQGKVPIFGFKPKQSGSGISVAIHKGRTVYIGNSFLATMSSGHEGVFSRGSYVRGQGFVPGREKTSSGKTRITELFTTSPLNMALSKDVAADAQQYMKDNIAERVNGLLSSKVEKAAKR